MYRKKHSIKVIVIWCALVVWGAAAPVGRAQTGEPASLVINYAAATAARVGGSNQVVANVMLLDANGQPVPDVRVQSAQIRLDDGTPVTASVNQGAAPIATMVVFDASGSMVGERVGAARTAVIDFANSKRPDDQIGVILFNDAIVYSNDFTTDRVTAISAVSYNPAQRTPGSCLWDTLYEAITRLRRLPGGRRAVVLVTDGRDQTLPGGPLCSQRTLDNVLDLATQGDIRVPVYTLGLGNAQSLNPDDLERLARGTGGDSAVTDITGEIGPRLAALVAALRAEFSLRAEITAGSGAHTLEVTVRLDSGEFVALGAVDVPATVFTPPTQPSPALPTFASGPASASTPTVVSIPAATLPPTTTEPPLISIVEARQNDAGDLALRLNVQERGAAVTAVIVLLDGQPLGTIPPGAFGGEITLPLDDIPLGNGAHTISVEAYDTGGQVSRDQLAALLRGPTPAAVAQVTATSSGLFTLSAPVSPSPQIASTPTGTPTPPASPTETPAVGGVVLPETSPTTQPPPAPSPESNPTVPLAFVLIGLIVLVGAAALVLIWQRSRRLARYDEGMLVEGDFRYDYYAQPPPVPAGRLPPVVEMEPTEIYERREEDHTVLYVGDRGKARLEVVRSLDTDARVNSPYTLDAQRVTLGRDTSNDIVFAGDRFVSSRHVRLLYVEGAWILEELGALNKTFVNGKDVTGRVFLSDGDLIELGPYTRMRFTMEKPPEQPPQPPVVPPRRYDDDGEGVTRIHRG